jgi:hypothetical protein
MLANIRPPFTFHQVGVRSIECQALPGREARALRAKIMRPASLPGPGGQVVLFPKTEVLPCRGARWARLTLRRRGRISEWNSFPADAFCAQRPCFPAISLPLPRKENRKSEEGAGANICRYFRLNELTPEDDLSVLRDKPLARFKANPQKDEPGGLRGASK